ncbi:MAG: hypothetical protein ACK4S4_05435 [Pyrinomonadaceae bacterium]
MITNFIKGAAEQIDNATMRAAARETFGIEKGEGAIRIRRKDDRPQDGVPNRDIYDRARMIYLRARRPRMTRASAIF